LRSAVDRWLPASSSAHRIDPWLERWLRRNRERVESGERSASYVKELERWCAPDGHLASWTHRSVHEIDYATLDEWVAWLAAERKLSAKTTRNVVAAISATDLLRQGVSERVLQALLGHRDTRSTRRYARLADEALVAAIRPRCRSSVDPAANTVEEDLEKRTVVVEAPGIEPGTKPDKQVNRRDLPADAAWIQCRSARAQKSGVPDERGA
jgi:Phage integrase family